MWPVPGIVPALMDSFVKEKSRRKGLRLLRTALSDRIVS